MNQFIVMCVDIKDVWNEIDHITESKSKYVTHVDNKNAIVTLGDEQYVYCETWSTLSGCNNIDGWMLTDRVKSSNAERIERSIKKLTNRYIGVTTNGETA
ncbi:hypothetical protein [Listeria seeligeri]|uniref:hypothetical protein n=1 Tax=Listeria seeligeri TaxID=1640 RepID=UPI001889C1EE|nr:hypothetical protein [Listeria seeligeri]MBF2653952.1 hypothetical protein [Listeria seeligeri]